LSDDANIDLISRNCVPVALDLLKIQEAPGPGGDFFRIIYGQTKKVQYQGLWLVTADGQLLSYTCGEGLPEVEVTKLVRRELQAGLEKFGPVTSREFVPSSALQYRGVGVRADGSVTLAVTDKQIIEGAAKSTIARSYGKLTYIGEVTLSAEDWAALAPAEASPGSRWTVSQTVGRQFFTLLSPYDTKFKSPDQVAEVQLAGQVRSVHDGIAYLTFSGRIAGKFTATGNWAGHELFTTMKMVYGIGAYDVEARRMLALKWLWEGAYSNFYRPPYRGQPEHFGAVVEWRAGSDGDAPRAVASRAPASTAAAELTDSTPEGALRAFLVALAAHDEPALRALSLPHSDFASLLRGQSPTPDDLAQSKARLDGLRIKQLKAGDAVKMPNGESRAIKPDDVRAGRVVLWAEGELLPTRLENVDGHWKVFPGTFIATRK
jgi:hypothetical protein